MTRQVLFTKLAIMLTTKTTAISHCLFLVCALFISACANQNQSTFTAQPMNGETGDIFYLGRDPEYKDRSLMRVRNIELIVLDGVPGPAPDSMHLLNHTQINAGDSVLDLGTGSGIQAIFAARKSKRIVATDINPKAGENARLNIKMHGLENLIDVRVGDLFSPLTADEHFDVVLLNLKYPNTGEESPLWEVHERFFVDVKKHLKPKGRIYYQFGFLRNLETVEKMLAANQLYIADKKLGPSSVVKDAFFLTLEIRALPKTTHQ